jgi:hypothetical protein
VVFQTREERSAEDIATSFIAAYGDLNADQAITYLGDDADISELMESVGAAGVEGTTREFRQLISLLQAQGYKQMSNSCKELGSAADGTRLECTFDFHDLRSDEIGRGPFSGSYFELTVRDGEIVRASEHLEIERFSPQMWEPFARWVSKAHPDDTAVMYEGDFTGARLTDESIRLWERHTWGYADKVARS